MKKFTERKYLTAEPAEKNLKSAPYSVKAGAKSLKAKGRRAALQAGTE